MFEFIIDNLPLIIRGLILTVEVTLFGIFAGLALGTILAIGDMYGGRAVSTLIRVYVEFFRGSPIIVQLFIFRWTLPTLLNLPSDVFLVAFAVFALNSAAYQKGYIKGAMETIFQDQMDAGLSTGMSKAQTIYHVIIPQALRIVIPAWSNEFCSLTKSTAALGLIGLMDLTGAGRAIIGKYYIVIQTWLFIAIVYLIWITIFTRIADIIYEKKKIPGIEISA
jgi:polar amino acid transport system permease protein